MVVNRDDEPVETGGIARQGRQHAHAEGLPGGLCPVGGKDQGCRQEQDSQGEVQKRIGKAEPGSCQGHTQGHESGQKQIRMQAWKREPTGSV